MMGALKSHQKQLFHALMHEFSHDGWYPNGDLILLVNPPCLDPEKKTDEYKYPNLRNV